MKIAFALSTEFLRSVALTNHVANCARCMAAAETHRWAGGRQDGKDDWHPLDTDADWCPEGARRLALVAVDVGESVSAKDRINLVRYVRDQTGASIHHARQALTDGHWSADRAIKILREKGHA